MSVLVVLSTTPDVRTARRIARVLIEKRLAACVSFHPGLESIYRWKSKIEVSREVLLLAKTTSAKFNSLRKAILEMHPYDIPEILALPAAQGHTGYLNWLSASLRSEE